MQERTKRQYYKYIYFECSIVVLPVLELQNILKSKFCGSISLSFFKKILNDLKILLQKTKVIDFAESQKTKNGTLNSISKCNAQMYIINVMYDL